MSQSGIIRLRGDAPNLVWPVASLVPHLDWCAELRRLTPDPFPYTAEEAVRRGASKQLREWQRAMLAARRDAAAEFAAAQGWRSADRQHPLSRLVRDRRERQRWPAHKWAHCMLYRHPEWLVSGRRVVGCVIHVYDRLPIEELPPSIVVDQLPASWYYPQWATAYVYRPAARAVERVA